MAKISSFIYTDKTNFPEDSMYPEIGNILDALKPDFIPGNFSFSIVLTLIYVEKGKTLRLEFRDPEGEIAAETDEMPLMENENDTDDVNGVFIGLDFRNVPLEIAGVYETTVLINNEVIGQFPIPVLKGSDENDDSD